MNLYAYANGNPVVNVDPLGHWAVNIITVEWAGSVFNALIGAAVGGVGYGAIQAFIRKVGRDAAARIFTRTITSKLIAWGAGKFAVGLGWFVDTVLDHLNIGLKIAKWIDSKDARRYNNWITIGNGK